MSTSACTALPVSSRTAETVDRIGKILPSLCCNTPLDRVAVDTAVGEPLDGIQCRIPAGREDLRDRCSDELVSAESRHRAESVVDAVDVERREVDDQLPERSAIEHAPVHAQAFLEAGLMGSIEPAPAALTPSVPGALARGDLLVALSLLYHYASDCCGCRRIR